MYSKKAETHQYPNSSHSKNQTENMTIWEVEGISRNCSSKITNDIT